jgi:hypothetical protein
VTTRAVGENLRGTRQVPSGARPLAGTIAAVSPLAPVDPDDVHAALAIVAPRLSLAVRSIRQPAAHAVGSWDAVDVAVHLAHVWENLTALADHEIDSPLQELAELDSLTQALVSQDADRDPAALADRIDVRAAAFLSDPSALSSDALSPWLMQGIRVPRVALACHILSESLVHGHDIARAQRARWTIEASHARLALMGFTFPLLGRLDPRALVDQDRARGFDACYEVTVRGAGRVFLSISQGRLTVDSHAGRRVDCHLSAEPVTLLLLLFGRVGQWPAILTGKLFAWGRKPWWAPRLRQVLRNP